MVETAHILPPWADVELSAALPEMVARDETQAVEFKRQLPEQVRDIAKEIAAFSTSNDGTILIGVSDDGMIVGLPELASPAERDRFSLRILGVCESLVKPLVVPVIAFAAVDARVVAVVRVQKGSEPVYYWDDRPVMRVGTSARFCAPQEVVDLVRASTARGDAPENGYRYRLANLIVEIRVKMANPERLSGGALETLGGDAVALAMGARGLAVDAPEDFAGVRGGLADLANRLDDVAYVRADFDHLHEYVTTGLVAREAADAIWSVWLEGRLGAELEPVLESTLTNIASELSMLADRAELTGGRGRLGELRQEAGMLGAALCKVAGCQSALNFDPGSASNLDP